MFEFYSFKVKGKFSQVAVMLDFRNFFVPNMAASGYDVIHVFFFNPQIRFACTVVATATKASATNKTLG